MKRIFLLSILLCVGLMVHAQTAEKQWAVGFWGGAYYGDKLEDAGLMSELYLSRYLTPSFDAMVLNNNGLINSKSNQTFDMETVFLNLRYKLSNGKIFKQNSLVEPYLFAGPGWIWDNKTSSLNFDAGGGVKFLISPNLAVFAEGGYINGLSSNTARDNNTFSENFIKGVAGIEISFGKKRKKDRDLDGVIDRLDKCPDTPIGVKVNEKGCPLDTDGDGIPDYKDGCPTEAGSMAFNGCPDKDNDGVIDKNDICPDTPGLKEFNGCPDSDGDGVVDSKDQCPGTPKGYKVDENGCPFDQDNDGIVNEEDDCPDIAGPKENKGCPVAKKDIEKINWVAQNILFNTNSSVLTRESYSVLDQAVDILEKNKTYKLSIGGYTDNVGTAKYNFWLSDRRANSVKNYIISKGIEASRLDAKGYGPEHPIDTNSTEEGRVNNRRVELKLRVQ